MIENNSKHTKLKKAQPIKKLSLNSLNGKTHVVEKLQLFKHSTDSKLTLLSENSGNTPKPRKKPSQTITEIIHKNINSKSLIDYSSEHFSICFEQGALLTPNVIFSTLQTYKKLIFDYKKSWHNIVNNQLSIMDKKIKNENLPPLPFFTDNTVLQIYRTAPKNVDIDSLVIMFKYILDALKYDKKTNPLGILEDDNPNVIYKVESISQKGPNSIALRLYKKENTNKQTIDIHSFLTNGINTI